MLVEPVRCARFKKLREKFDQDIDANVERANNSKETRQEGTTRVEANSTKYAKARSLNTHLANCPICK